MASSSSGSYAISQETTNFARICRIVVDVLRDILWQVLIHEIPAADLPSRVRMNQKKLAKLDVKINAWLCGISSSSTEIPIAEKFDVTSLYTLIRNLCSQVPTPSTQWGKPPPPGGTTLGDDIERIREFRNSYCGNAIQAKIDTTDFNNLCIAIQNVVSRFDAYFSSHSMKCDFKSAVDTVLTCSMDKSLQDTYVEIMKEIARLSDDVKNEKQQVGNIIHQVFDVNQKVGDMEQKVEAVEQHNVNVEQQVVNVEQQVGDVKQIVWDVEQKVVDVEQQVVNVEQQVGIVKQRVGEVDHQVGIVKQKIGDVERQVSDLEQLVKEEVVDIKAHLKKAIPAEILRMNDRSIQLFKDAMKDGEANVFNIRVMVVGHLGVGKTTLIKRFLEKEVNINERQSTEGIIVHVHCCKVSQDGSKWTLTEGDLEQNLRLQRLAKVLNDQVEKRHLTEKRSKQREKKDHAGDHAFHFQPVSQDIPSSSDPDKFPSNPSNEQGVKEMESTAAKISDDAAMEFLKLLHAKADKIKQETDIPLTILDFAGHFAFYTTHQTFLTDRAIYLLVSDISKQVTDPVTDDCYFDTEGIKLCKVYELVEVWLNSIHSCTPSPGAKTPPVILVGTHVDQIQQDSREEVCKRYFRQIRYEYLGSKPTIVHLADEDFAIDNTVIDQKLDELKQKIIQLASEQPYWGQAIPVRWLTLEEHMMSLKAAGVKVIPYFLLEEMNQKEAVKIESREELDLFLKFQHDIGNILYFGTERLKDQIMLDPQWLIYSLRTIITAEDFILKKTKTPAVIQKWREFKETGKLTQELIDAIWTKENNPECHDNKDLIIRLMEKLNIIARPRSLSKDKDEVKEENYFIAPCILCEKTPLEIICPKPDPETDNSSVLCYVFVEKYLPAPIFHRLLAACIAHWPIATQHKENMIFCGCCVFQLRQNHKLTLYFNGHVIFVRVARKGIKDKTPSPKMCIEVRELITDMLIDIIGNLGQNLKFEYCIQCLKCNGDTVNGLIPVSQLKKKLEVECDFNHMIESHQLLNFWFQDLQVESNVNPHEECHSPVQRRYLPPGKKYHIFFSYSSSDIQWVKNTVETLEKEHGFVCCEYDRDNTPGTSLLKFAGDSIRDAYKTVVVMTREALKSGFVLHEIEMAIIQGYNESRKCVVPVLLEDCEVPAHLNVLNYIDARDPKLKNIWWPKFITELETVKLQPLALGALETALSEVEML